ncbi:protein lifeguard 3-like [Liasis olivaceus]
MSGAKGDRSCEMEEGDFQIAYWVEKNVRQTFIRKVSLMPAPLGRPDQEINSTRRLKLLLLRSAKITESDKSDCAVIPPPSYASVNEGGVCLSHFCVGFGLYDSMHKAKAVILAMIITTVITITVTIFFFQTKVDLTTWTGFFCILAIVLLVTSVITTVVLIGKYIYWVHMLYSAICAIIFTLFLAYDTQLLLGSKRFSISPEAYIYGAIQIYVDVIYIFLSFLRLGSRH